MCWYSVRVHSTREGTKTQGRLGTLVISEKNKAIWKINEGKQGSLYSGVIGNRCSRISTGDNNEGGADCCKEVGKLTLGTHWVWMHHVPALTRMLAVPSDTLQHNSEVSQATATRCLFE